MHDYDIVVIGAGIHGAGVAQAAAAAGYAVLVLEQSTIAGATSSRSSKLIHGGLRYLETGQIALVRECLRERSLLIKLAPELVRLRPFYIPIYRHNRRRPWHIRVGLSGYALLSGGRRDTHFHSIPQSKWSGLSGLDSTNLEAVFCYLDGQTDDAALTHAVMCSALELGAALCMPAQFQGAEIAADGYTVHYRYADQIQSCRSTVIVNAAGPWVNEVLLRMSPVSHPLPIELVQGSHIVLENEAIEDIYYVEACAGDRTHAGDHTLAGRHVQVGSHGLAGSHSHSDRRAIFVMPHGTIPGGPGKLLVGTTEIRYSGAPAKVHPSSQEIDYLLHNLAYYFPAYRNRNSHPVLESFSGLRVLPSGSGSAFTRSRETILHMDQGVTPGAPGCPRVLTIYGGKLTTYRATAQKVIERLSATLPKRRVIADTRELPLKPGRAAANLLHGLENAARNLI